MARPIASSGARTNRKFILFALALGALGAVLVYAAFSRPQSSTGGGAGANTPVVVAKTDIPARTKITESMIEVRLVGADGRSALAFTDTAGVVGQVTRFPIAASEQVLSSKVVALTTTSAAGGRSLTFVVPQGKRGIAIKVTGVTSAGSLILPGDYVDVLVVYDIEFQSDPKDPTSREKADSYLVLTLLQNVEVLAVQQTVVDIVPESTPTAGGQRVRNSEAKADPEAITVTLALSPEDAQKIYLAESNGRIRLALRPFGDADQPSLDHMIETDLFPKNLPNPFLR